MEDGPALTLEMAHFAKDVAPLIERFERLSQEQRSGLLYSILGAYVHQAEKETGDITAARKRAVWLLDAMLKRQEAHFG